MNTPDKPELQIETLTRLIALIDLAGYIKQDDEERAKAVVAYLLSKGDSLESIIESFKEGLVDLPAVRVREFFAQRKVIPSNYTIGRLSKIISLIGQAVWAFQSLAEFAPIPEKTIQKFHLYQSYAATDYPLGKNNRGMKKWSKRNPLQIVTS